MYGLLDCNNFFVSCERVFRPDLEGRPVVVLSNNDGCVVARSNEAKDMGIPMGLPYFQLPTVDPTGRVTAFSSNYTLYADMSRRVMSMLAAHFPHILPYSIDESFFELSLADLGEAGGLPGEVLRGTGVPVSVGVAPTKTLAKVACKAAKRTTERFRAITDESQRRRHLAAVPVGDVWGIGRRTLATLVKAGVTTAELFANLEAAQVRGLLGVTGLRTWQELRAIPAVDDDDVEHAKLSICTSRSFAKPLRTRDELRVMLSGFASRCAEKLLRQHSTAATLTIFAEASRFDQRAPGGFLAATHLDIPTDAEILLVRAAINLLERFFQEGVLYKRAGVVVSDIEEAGQGPRTLFEPRPSPLDDKRARLSAAVANIRARRGSEAVVLASSLPLGQVAPGKDGDTRTANLRRELLSPAYTTNWNELMQVH